MSATKTLTACQQLLRQHLTNSLNRVQGRFDTTATLWFPLTEAEYIRTLRLANRTLYRYNPAIENYTSYIEYDEYGGPIKRVDITGKSHMGVATPHVLEYSSNALGSLRYYRPPKKNQVRPAYEWELP